jgi:hypothetical protein
LENEAAVDTTSATISESTFLLTELRYTLGQIHVQIGDMDEKARGMALYGDRTISDILAEMQSTEDEYQEKYGAMLGVDVASLHPSEQIVPLPISDEVDENAEDQNSFEHNRAQTIAMLEGAGDAWPPALVDLVRRHVSADRTHTTQLAECRKQYFETDTRPDLDQSLTETEDVVREPWPPAESVHLESTSE